MSSTFGTAQGELLAEPRSVRALGAARPAPSLPLRTLLCSPIKRFLSRVQGGSAGEHSWTWRSVDVSADLMKNVRYEFDA